MEQVENQFLDLTREWDNELDLRYSNLIDNLEYITRFRLKLQSEFKNKLILLKSVGCDEIDLVSYAYHEGEYDSLIKRLIEFTRIDITPRIRMTIEALNSFIENLIQMLLNIFGSVAETIRFIKENDIRSVLSERVTTVGC